MLSDPTTITWMVMAIIVAISTIVVTCVLAYFVPGLVLRAIRDFKNRYGKGKGDSNGKMEEGSER